MKPKELTICGLAAVRARFAREPGSILRLFFDRATSRQVGAMSKQLAQLKRVYRCVEPAELEKIAGSIHHGGIVAVVTAPVARGPRPEDLRAWAAQRLPVLVLDRVGNAHNLGALARTAAFFGVKQLVIPDSPVAARPNDAAYRVSEGGLEQLTVWTVSALPEFLAALRGSGYIVIGAATRGGRPETAVPPGAPVAVVLGNEEHGLDPKVAAACTRLVTIPGGAGVESLNVSVAGAVLLWELVGRRGGSAEGR